MLLSQKIFLTKHRVRIYNVLYRYIRRSTSCCKMAYFLFIGRLAGSQYLFPFAISQFFKNYTNFSRQLCVRRQNLFRLETDISLFFSPDELSCNALTILVFNDKILETDPVVNSFSTFTGCLEALSHSNIKCGLGYREYVYLLFSLGRRKIVNHRLFDWRTSWNDNITFFSDGKFESCFSFNKPKNV